MVNATCRPSSATSIAARVEWHCKHPLDPEVLGSFPVGRICSDSKSATPAICKPPSDLARAFTAALQDANPSPPYLSYEALLSDLLWLPACIQNRRNVFASLHAVTRATILEAPVRDIVLMLEQNILAKFKLTPEMQQREERKLVELGG